MEQIYEQFMFTNKNIVKIIRECEEFIRPDNKFFNNSKNKNSIVQKPEVNKQLQPKTIANINESPNSYKVNINTFNNNELNKKHPIFWILYKMTTEADFFKKLDDVEEINYRIKFIETLKQNLGWVKVNKIKITHVETEAMDTKSDIPLLGAFFKAMCLYYKINVVVIKGQIFKIVSLDDDDFIPKFIINWNAENDKFVLIDDIEKIKLMYDNAKTNYYEFSKPLKSISAYKVDDLRDIARRLNISTADNNDKQLLKKPLYEKIISYLKF